MKSKEYKYKFSIVMAIYNVEDFLDEAIKSLISQTVDFQKHVQVILVNDGSPDNSGDICEKYAKEYPNNIVYINKENEGVSSARNAGIDVAEGKYINFLDPDDTLSPTTLQEIERFFEANKNITLAAIPIYFFDGQTGDHLLNKKFDIERIVDIDVDYDSFVLGGPTVFIHRETIGETRFIHGKKYAEDIMFLTEILMRIKKYGLVPSASYNYRKRLDGGSALNNAGADVDYYITHLADYIEEFEQYRDKETNKLPMYLQCIIAYNLQWVTCFKEYPDSLGERKEEFLELVYRLISELDATVIGALQHRNVHQRSAMFGIKNGLRNLETGLIGRQSKNLIFTSFSGDKRADSSTPTVSVNNLEYTDKMVNIGGFVAGSYFPNEMTSVFVKMSNGKEIAATELKYSYLETYFMGEKIHEHYGFLVSVDKELIDKCSSFSIYVKIGNSQAQANVNINGPFAKYVQKLPHSYLVADNKMVKYSKKEKCFEILPYTLKNLLKFELKNVSGIKRKTSKVLIPATRIYARISKKYSNKKINLFMDRIEKGNDNAEALYAYFDKNKKPNEKNYFVLGKDAKDYPRLKKQGFKLIPYGTLKHKLLLLKADNILSSSGDAFSYHPFDNTNQYYNDVKGFNYIFLTHGVAQGDISHWVRKSTKDFRMFLAASYDEKEMLINGNCQFSEREVKLTGLPRFDRLTTAEKPKNILIMPTWRYDVVSPVDPETNRRPYNEKFKETNYFKGWNNILKDEKLLECAKEKGYNLLFVPHPNVRQQLKDFDFTAADYAGEDVMYSDIFKDGAVLVTDYSSVHYDFSYLKKPVAYYHYDTGNYPYEFRYSEKGFGPVVNKEEELIEYLISLIENDCKMEEKYVQRVESFFAFTDKNNCARVYDEVQKIK